MSDIGQQTMDQNNNNTRISDTQQTKHHVGHLSDMSDIQIQPTCTYRTSIHWLSNRKPQVARLRERNSVGKCPTCPTCHQANKIHRW
jgi:hypothetical protein